MIRKYKGKLILSSLLILLPMLVGLLFWDRLPDYMTTHWGMDGTPDGVSTKWRAVIFLPLFLLLFHWIALFITFRDPKMQDQSPKTLRLVFWILPFISLFVNGILYAALFAADLQSYSLVPLCLGLAMAIIGNYLPKVKQNSYLGIKTKWTLNNEENWNATHRFCGKVWFFTGLLILLGILLPVKWMLPYSLVLVAIMCVITLLYSYLYYRKQLAAGAAPISKTPVTGKKKLTMVLTGLLVAVLAALLIYLMFSGEIQVRFGEQSFTIEADYWEDLTVDYAAVEEVRYVEDFDFGQRIGGFSSGRLDLGSYMNDEFGRYTLYAYHRCDTVVILKSQGKVLALGGETIDDTIRLYETLEEVTQ